MTVGGYVQEKDSNAECMQPKTYINKYHTLHYTTLGGKSALAFSLKLSYDPWCRAHPVLRLVELVSLLLESLLAFLGLLGLLPLLLLLLADLILKLLAG